MKSIDLADETDRLEREFALVVESLGSHAVSVSASLVSIIGLRRGAGNCWTGQFSALTALYPLLQSEGLAGVSRETARRATLGHFCLMVHAFIEDRQFDGQLKSTRDGLLFSKSMLLEGWGILHGLPLIGDSFGRMTKEIMVAYGESYAPRDFVEVGDSLSDGYVLAAGSGMAAYGAVAPVALACCLESQNGVVSGVKRAFDCLATGLQWADDIEDWAADLDSGDRNFLLDTLKLRGFDAWELRPGSERGALVGQALVEKEVLHHAVGEARRWVNGAVQKQELLNCHQLAAQIQENFRPLDGAEKRFLVGIEL